MKSKATYYEVVEIGGVLFGTQEKDEAPPQQIQRVCNAAMVVCRDLVARLTTAKSPIPAEDAARVRLIEHAQEVVDLVQEIGRIERARGGA